MGGNARKNCAATLILTVRAASALKNHTGEIRNRMSADATTKTQSQTPAANAKATEAAGKPAGAPESKAESKPKAKPNPGPFPDLSIRFSGIALKNPIIAASGTFGYGIEFEDIVSLEKLGGFVSKGLSREPMPGNPPPRIFETAAGMLNSIGLQNIGARAFVEEKLPLLRKKKDVVVICNVFGYTRQDYEAVIRILNEGEGIAAYELNVSCPNTSHGGISFGSDPVLLEEVVVSAKNAAHPRPVIVKLSPNVTSIPRMAHAAQNAGADAISLVNTFVAMAIDAETRKPRISNITAGLSGPAIKPIALRMVYEAAHSVDIPVIGLGGISTAEDVIEFMLAGAAAVQVGTANYWDPCATEKIVEGVRAWCIEHRVERVTDLIGGLET
jgi:dihydroorotate dehydrogenase (NAD+) catalytic subunit